MSSIGSLLAILLAKLVTSDSNIFTVSITSRDPSEDVTPDPPEVWLKSASQMGSCLPCLECARLAVTCADAHAAHVQQTSTNVVSRLFCFFNLLLSVTMHTSHTIYINKTS